MLLGALSQSDLRQQPERTPPPLGAWHPGGDQRQLDVRPCGQHRQQVVELEDEADGVAAVGGRVIEIGDADPVDQDPA